MSSARMSMIFRPETNGYGQGGAGNWYAPPPGTTWTDDFQRATGKVPALGAKSFEASYYGKTTMNFNWKFTLDYNYLEPLCFIYEAWEENKCLDEDASYDPLTGRLKRITTKASGGTHIFYKTNASRVKSFEVRSVLLHRIVNPEDNYDEVRIIRGCTAKGATYSPTNSTITVTMNGTCAIPIIYYVYAESTDYVAYSDQSLVEWACYLQDGEEFVKTVETFNFATTSTVDTVYSICGPSPQNYHEDGTTYTLSLTAYTDEYDKFKTRALFSGGDVFSGDYVDIGSDEPNKLLGQKFTPATRGLASMKKAVLQSSTTNMVAQMDTGVDGEGDNGDGLSLNGSAFTFGSTLTDGQKANAVKVTLFNGLITSKAEWKGEANSKLTEQLSLEGNMLCLEFRNGNAHVWRNYVKKGELAYGYWKEDQLDGNPQPIILPDDTYNGCPNQVPTNKTMTITTVTDTCE